MKYKRYWAVILAALFGVLTMSVPAHAVTNPTITLPVAYPQGVAMDFLNWGATGTSASCATGTVNDAAVNAGTALVGVWKTTGAGCAAGFIKVPLTIGGIPPGPNGPFEIVYAPNGVVATNGGADPSGFCVSTYANVIRTHNRIRHCSAALAGLAASEAAPNVWQNFRQVPGLFDSDTAVLILNVASGLAENDSRYGGNGSPVITYTAFTDGNAANEGWTFNP
jgi:hypothetical protein